MITDRASVEVRNRTRAVKAALDVLARTRRGAKRGPAYPSCLAPLAELRAEVEYQIVLGVRGAIESGHTWGAVAEQLGVSRQAAHERYAPQILALAQDAQRDPG
jgi:hypothetical protein